MTHATSLIFILTAGFVLAFIFGAIASRLKLSPLVGYILAGVIAGPFTPGFAADPNLAQQLAEVGVILLMFGVGLHFSIDDLLSVRNTALPSALIRVNVFTLVGWGAAVMFGWGHGAGLVFGLALSVASTVVLLRALESRGQIETEKGRTAIGLLVVEDLICVFTLVMLPVIAPYFVGGAEPSAFALIKAIGIAIFKVGAFVALMLIVGTRMIPWVLEKTAALGSRELFTLGILAIALGVAFGSSYFFGVSFALGAFFAGTLLNGSEFSKQAADETLPLRDAFAVLFFVSVGMLFDPLIFIEEPLKVLITVLIVVAVKALLGYLIVYFVTKQKGAGILAGVGLAQIGEFSFILGSLGLSLKMLPKDGADMILAAAIVSIMLNPFMLKIFDRWKAKQDLIDTSDRAYQLIPTPESELKSHVIVVGFGRVGQEIANVLKPRGVSLAVIDAELRWIEKAREQSIPAMLANANNPGALSALSPQTATIAIIAIPNVLEGGEIINHLRQLNPSLSIIARAHSQAAMKHYLEHGADAAVLAERELAHSLGEMVMALPQYRGSAQLPQTVR